MVTQLKKTMQSKMTLSVGSNTVIKGRMRCQIGVLSIAASLLPHCFGGAHWLGLKVLRHIAHIHIFESTRQVQRCLIFG